MGELRVSQTLTTYGVGSTVDLPHLSVLVLGLDDWPDSGDVRLQINEPRLLRAVQAELPTVTQLRRVPVEEPNALGLNNPLDANQFFGLPARAFPRWLVCPACRTLASLDSGLFALEADRYGRPERARYVHVNCQKSRRPPPAVAARFMVACENGHLDDFPWIQFVHRGQPCASPALQLLEQGPSGEARDLAVKCVSCGAERRMADAFNREQMPPCSGRRPHLRDYDPDGCGHAHARTILLGASNLWFPVLYSAIAIPDAASKLEALVQQAWPTLSAVREPSDLEFMQRRGELQAFAEFELSDVFKAIQNEAARRRDAHPAGGDAPDAARAEQHESLKAPEWRIFTQPSGAPQTDDFRLRAVAVPARYCAALSQVVLVERLREVRAFVGFTRIDAPGEIADLDREIIGSQLAPLSRRPPCWVPAAEMRGEGIFLQFNEDKIQRWLSEPECEAWAREFLAGHRRWRASRGLQDQDRGFPGLRYVLLHTISHALMRQFALECGYAQASMRERIYSREPDDSDGPMAGILIYTSAPDSEGTLGGLVRLGETDELEHHLTAALESAALCSSDPTCAEHEPDQSEMSLHGAACHACLFAPETSCECGNRYLDRSVLVETLVERRRAFFQV
ncbi:MAG: DUF1998 domain-containing protein [Thermoflexales bacterium]|nr:DUF1998 domain-containing protein [Thermoflexales bacterium]MDW8352655.1 DUF1998 domain-containing protein [Anaerolineae bacterium]